VSETSLTDEEIQALADPNCSWCLGIGRETGQHGWCIDAHLDEKTGWCAGAQRCGCTYRFLWIYTPGSVRECIFFLL